MRTLIALLLMTAPALAGDVALEYENFYFDRAKGRARIIVKLTNNSQAALEMVVTECAFLGKDKKALDVATLIATDIPVGQSAYSDSWSAKMSGIETAQCRVSSSR